MSKNRPTVVVESVRLCAGRQNTGGYLMPRQRRRSLCGASFPCGSTYKIPQRTAKSGLLRLFEMCHSEGMVSAIENFPSIYKLTSGMNRYGHPVVILAPHRMESPNSDGLCYKNRFSTIFCRFQLCRWGPGHSARIVTPLPADC